MLGRLILILLQITVGWFATNALMSQIKFGEFRLFIFAVIAAIVVYLLGVIAAQVIKDVGAPSNQSLTMALFLALGAAAVVTWGPALLPQVPWRQVPDKYLVMAAAIAGTILKK
jgi:hypothetical protein